MPATSSTTLQRPHAFVSLLSGYIAGTVDDDAMARFDDLFEDVTATTEERLAFARFYLDVVATGEVMEALPAPTEIPGLLAVARA